MFVTPSAVLILPLAAVATLRRDWALGLLAASVPFYSLTVVELFSHPFPPHEIALLSLFTRQMWTWVSQGRVVVDHKRAMTWAISFSVVCIISVLLAVVRPANVLVHQYNIGGFGTFDFRQLSLTSANITQLLLRLFYIGSIFIIVDAIKDQREVRRLVRWIVFGAVFAGIVGVLYQVSILLDGPLPAIMHWLGFNRFPTNPRFIQGIPRMYSLPGEPGFTADYLLYALAITATAFFTRADSGILTRRESVILTAVLGTFLLLSTGTTGYGGLGVFVGVLFVGAVAFEQLRSRRFLGTVLVGIVAVPVLLIADMIVFGGVLQQLIQYAIEKITFDAGSGSIRLRYMLRTVDVFLARPLLGVGVGSHHVPSMLFTLAAEVGLIGVFVFTGFHISVYRSCCWFATKAHPMYAGIALPILVAGVTLLFTNLVAKSIATLLFPWYWFSLALPLALVATWRSDGRKDSNVKTVDSH